MKKGLLIMIIVLSLMGFSGCIGDYTRVATVCIGIEGDQVLWDSYGELWMVKDELPVGAVVELTLRDGGNLNDNCDDYVVDLKVLSVPQETEPACEETVVAPLIN